MAREGSRAVVVLGDKYFFGAGVPQDAKKAVSLFAMAAVVGNCNAEYGLGLAFEDGKGVPQSYEKAMDWFRRISTLFLI